jgi:hypothetical protein
MNEHTTHQERRSSTRWGPGSVADVVAKAGPNPPADAEDGGGRRGPLEDGVTP